MRGRHPALAIDGPGEVVLQIAPVELVTCIDRLEQTARLLQAAVGLVRALGGGWERGKLPKDDEIQPFDVFRYQQLEKPDQAGGIDVSVEDAPKNDDLRGPAAPRPSAAGR